MNKKEKELKQLVENLNNSILENDELKNKCDNDLNSLVIFLFKF